MDIVTLCMTVQGYLSKETYHRPVVLGAPQDYGNCCGDFNACANSGGSCQSLGCPSNYQAGPDSRSKPLFCFHLFSHPEVDKLWVSYIYGIYHGFFQTSGSIYSRMAVSIG